MCSFIYLHKYAKNSFLTFILFSGSHIEVSELLLLCYTLLYKSLKLDNTLNRLFLRSDILKKTWKIFCACNFDLSYKFSVDNSVWITLLYPSLSLSHTHTHTPTIACGALLLFATLSLSHTHTHTRARARAHTHTLRQ